MIYDDAGVYYNRIIYRFMQEACYFGHGEKLKISFSSLTL